MKFVIAALAASLLAVRLQGFASNRRRDAKAAATVPVSLAAIEAEARGFTVGSPMSARTVYVFFDPQCPHCAALWEAAKPLKPPGQVRLDTRWAS